MKYRSMKRIHVLGCRHLANPHNPPYLCLATPRASEYAYRTALCGQTAYCREVKEGFDYEDQFGLVPFVSWRRAEHVTCQSCLRALRK